ncbi:MAG: flavodoxin [Actinomycetota bacterium]|nr:flavodoxin [Actinomycetota bacterium]
MLIVVVYESSYGNTHVIASAIGEGMHPSCHVEVVSVAVASQDLVDAADLLVVGGPTHVHGMSRVRTRKAAVDAAREPASKLTLDPDAESPGLRAWFGSVRPATTPAAAFDTRVDAPALLTGRAATGISRQLRRRGFREISEPMSFLVTRDNELVAGQQASARQWGSKLASILISDRGLAARIDPEQAGNAPV